MRVSQRSYRLRGGEPAAAGMSRIARGRAERAAERLRKASGDDLADAIHGARKDLKKLRAALRLVRDELGQKLFERENQRYREAARLLATSRDAEVKLQTLRALRERSGARLPAEAADAWEAALLADRDRLASAEAEELGERIKEAREMIERGAREIGDWPLREEGWKLVGAGLTEAYREGREELEVVRAGGSDLEIHELRKRVKDLWYQQRLLVEAWPGPIGAAVAELDSMAEMLGEHHDLSLLATDLGERGEAVAGGPEIASLIASRQGHLLEGSLGIGDRLYAEKPKAFRRRHRAYWRAWRPDRPPSDE